MLTDFFFQLALKSCQVNILFQSALFVSPQATKQHTRGNPSGTQSPSKSLYSTHQPAVDLRDVSSVGQEVEGFFSTLEMAGFYYHAIIKLKLDNSSLQLIDVLPYSFTTRSPTK